MTNNTCTCTGKTMKVIIADFSWVTLKMSLLFNTNNLPSKKQASGMSKSVPWALIFVSATKFVVFLSITKTKTATTCSQKTAQKIMFSENESTNISWINVKLIYPASKHYFLVAQAPRQLGDQTRDIISRCIVSIFGRV